MAERPCVEMQPGTRGWLSTFIIQLVATHSSTFTAIDKHQHDNLPFIRLLNRPSTIARAVQYYWNTVNAEVTTDRLLTPLQHWRVVECLKELGSALWSLSDVLANLCRTSPSNPVGVTLALQVQGLASSREPLTLIYRVQAGREIHDHDEIEANVALVTPAYAQNKAEWPDELSATFLALMNRCAAERKRAPREVVRYAGQGPVGHSQNRRQAISVSSDDPEDAVPKPDPSPPVRRGWARDIMGSRVNIQASEPRMLIDGELVGASDGNTFPLFNPATGEQVANVPEATLDDVNRAVSAAKRAFPEWSALDPAKRGSYMKKLAVLIREHNDELALLEAKSMGRPLPEFFEGYVSSGSYEHYAEAWPHIQGQASLNTPGYVTMTLRQPFGVVAAIIPWNASLLFFASKSAPALITGNTVVLKSSEKAPLGAAKFAELIHKAGFPPGVFNVISGHGSPSGAALSSHMDVRAISFTGSSRTGRAIQEAAAKSNLKKVILELGGKSPVIIFEDADIDQAVKDTMHSIQWNSGQACMANSRVYVQESVSDKFVEGCKKALATVKAGDPTEKGVNHGPQADKTQYETVMSYIDEGKKSGTLALGGEGNLDKTGGFFVEPTIFLNTAEDAKIMKEEVFGPVVNINIIKTEEEAIAKANDTEYGLYAAVYTKNIDRAMRVVKQLDSGYVGINCTSPTTARDLPFGGYKSSGQGREGWLCSMENFLEVKSVIMKVESKL
ncbi:hypothetical protein KAF25_009602 [Fusarium avenaceum]|uniref:aldehyde dehydrogenase (NAD(+)) n=1 Tax=Fusarium avenaceum TaxID=40199 RepID=A0A9P7H9F7_9HYPO|nr:hypothetical protein KAF25_009602 [Fusarium avenaceum]